MAVQRFAVFIAINVVKEGLIEPEPPTAEDLVWALDWRIEMCCEDSRHTAEFKEADYLFDFRDGEVWSVDVEHDGHWDHRDISEFLESFAQNWEWDDVQIRWDTWPSVDAFQAEHVLETLSAL